MDPIKHPPIVALIEYHLRRRHSSIKYKSNLLVVVMKECGRENNTAKLNDCEKHIPSIATHPTSNDLMNRVDLSLLVGRGQPVDQGDNS